MSILSDIKILEKIYDKELIIDPFIYDHIQPASIDLTLSDKLKIPKADINKPISVFDKNAIESIYEEANLTEYVLAPNDFVIGQIKEKITIPKNCNGHIQNRNSLIRAGIDVGLSSYINPGYSGQLPIVIKNIGKFSIVLTPGMRICQLVIQEVKPDPAHDYSSKRDAKYHDEKDITLPKMHQENEFLDFLKEKGLTSIGANDYKSLTDFFENRLKQKSETILEELTLEQKSRLGLD